MYIRTYSKLLSAFIMHSITSFLDFQILKLIHFQKNFQGGARQSQLRGGRMLPLAPPERNPVMCKNFNDYVQVKTLMRLQKSSAGQDEKLIINFMCTIQQQKVRKQEKILALASKKDSGKRWLITISSIPTVGSLVIVCSVCMP